MLLLIACEGEKQTEQLQDTVIESEDERIFISNEQWRSNNYQLTTILDTMLPSYIEATGKITLPPQYEASVNSNISGIIKEIRIQEGDFVQKGAKIATIQNLSILELQKEYAYLTQQLGYLRKEYERKKLLADEKLIPQKQFWDIENQRNTAQSQYDAMTQQLKAYGLSPELVAQGKTQSIVGVYAPISGYVVHVDLVKGSAVEPTTPIASLLDKRKLQLELDVFEKDINLVKQGRSVLFTIPEMSTSTTYTSVIDRIGVALSQDRKVKVFGALPQPNTGLLKGMFVQAKIEVESAQTATLPVEAIVSIDNGYEALLLDEKSEAGYYLKRMPIEVIERTPTLYKLEGTMNGQRQFLRSGAFHLMD